MPIYLGSHKLKDLYIGGNKIKEAYLGSTKVFSSTVAVPQQYKCTIRSTVNDGLVTCKYLKCNDVFPDEPYGGRTSMITGWTYRWGYGYTEIECTFYFTGTLSTFKYTTIDSAPSEYQANMAQATITLVNLSTSTVVLTRTLTPSYATTYTYTL